MRKALRDLSGIREVVLLVIGCIVTIVWALAVLVPLVLPGHTVSGQVHVVMLTVAGALFGGAALTKRKSNGNGK